MNELFMSTQPDVESMPIVVEVLKDPVKTEGGPLIDNAVVQEQVEQARESLVAVDYEQVRGTCGDERERIGLLSGEAKVEPRPSVFGGPNLYLLDVLELTGFFVDENQDVDERLHTATRMLTDGKLLSGGHIECKAAQAFGAIIATIAEHPDQIKDYVKLKKEDTYDEAAISEVISNAQKVVASGRYAKWNGEEALIRELGDEAGEAMERLAPVAHDGTTFIDNEVDGTTVDQTDLYHRSVTGKGSFIWDHPYADIIEHIATSGPDAVHKKVVAEHARQAFIAAVAGAVPNEVIYEGALRAQ